VIWITVAVAVIAVYGWAIHAWAVDVRDYYGDI